MVRPDSSFLCLVFALLASSSAVQTLSASDQEPGSDTSALTIVPAHRTSLSTRGTQLCQDGSGDGEVYGDYIVVCGSDLCGADPMTRPVSTSAACIHLCNRTEGCVGVSWHSNRCYTKTEIPLSRSSSKVQPAYLSTYDNATELDRGHGGVDGTIYHNFEVIRDAVELASRRRGNLGVPRSSPCVISVLTNDIVCRVSLYMSYRFLFIGSAHSRCSWFRHCDVDSSSSAPVEDTVWSVQRRKRLA